MDQTIVWSLMSSFITGTGIFLIFHHIFKQNLNRLQDHLHQENLRRVEAQAQAERLPHVERTLENLRQELFQASQERIKLETLLQKERTHAQEKIKMLQEAELTLSQAFKALSAEALAVNNKSFLELAKITLEKFQNTAQQDLTHRQKSIDQAMLPIKDALGQVHTRLQELEKARLSAYDLLRHQVQELAQSQQDLRFETAKLVKALRAPSVRGRWGEMQLKRVVELSGLTAHCDFIEQASFEVEGEQRRLRPDMIVNLPGGKHLIIDAKVPLEAYLEALEATDETVRTHNLKTHARQVRDHIKHLSSRAYWDHLPTQTSPDFVVLFLPADTFFAAALEYDPTLIEIGIGQKVILATPSTLIAMLHAVAYGWRQEVLAKNAQEVSALGKELYKRLTDMGSHIQRLGRDLTLAVKSYNSTVGSLETRVLPGARKFKDLEVASGRDELPSLPAIDMMPTETRLFKEAS